VGLDKFTNMYTRYRQWDSGIQAYGDWYYNANGYVVKAYDFFTSNSNVSTIIDGFRTISDDELIDSVRVHAITAPDSGITLDVNKCSSSGNTFSSIFGDQDLRPALESGITAATFTGMSITSLIQDDLVSVDIDISNDSAANVGISLRTIEFTN